LWQASPGAQVVPSQAHNPVAVSQVPLAPPPISHCLSPEQPQMPALHDSPLSPPCLEQSLPQLPQFADSILVSVSQPSSGPVAGCAQSPNPASQRWRHRPWTQPAPTDLVVPHARWQAPQCAVLIVRSVSQPLLESLLQSPKPVSHDFSAHLLWAHSGVALAIVQGSQLVAPQPKAGSSWTTHCALQVFSLALQPVAPPVFAPPVFVPPVLVPPVFAPPVFVPPVFVPPVFVPPVFAPPVFAPPVPPVSAPA
jgi:hypothetical protein